MGRKKPTARDEENPIGTKSKKKGHVIGDDEYSIDLSEDQQNEGSEKQNHEDVTMSAAAGKKGKKGSSKSVQFRDEEHEKPLEEEEDDAPATDLMGKKKSKSKKGGNNNLFSASNFDVLEDEDAKEIDGHEENEDSDGEDEPVVAFSGKKKSLKSKKNNSLFTASAFDALDEGVDIVINESDQKLTDGDKIDNVDVPVIAFSGKKKSSNSSKKSTSLFTSSALGELDEGDDVKDENKEEDDDVPLVTFSGKKNTSKSSKNNGNLFTGSSFGDLDEEDDNKDGNKVENDDAPFLAFSGKKKSSKSSKKSGSLYTTALLDEEDGDYVSTSEQQLATRSADETIDENIVENEDIPTISLSGKKKSSKSKKNNSLFTASSFDMGHGDEEREEPSVSSSKLVNGKNSADAKVNKQGSEDAMESSKNKKKKKKSGRTAQEEDDLDKILAELGEGPPLPKPTVPPPEMKVAPPLEEANVHAHPEEVDPVDSKGEEKESEEVGESAAAKKKRKKKEKEKEKKAAAAASAVVVEVKEEKQEETKTKISDKKVPKQKREMLEIFARRKEAEERKKREEEEKLRKEEEERRRQEELERQAEEARHRKKEREKEKLLKKKQEGKLLTVKQKEEARRLEAMRNQFLAHGGGILTSGETSSGPTKRPIYQTKKAKPAHVQANDLAHVRAVEKTEAKENQETSAEVTEAEEVDEVEPQKIEEKVEAPQVVEENGIEDEDEWDAKSWDDAAVNLPVKSAFDEEVSVPVVKKESKRTTPPVSGDIGAPAAATKTTVSTKKVTPPYQMKTENLESKVDHPEVQVTDSNRRKESAGKKEARHAEGVSNRSPDNLRSPICCIMGHVDTGKTKLLDCIRGTNVQLGEAGGITQQIGATYFPAENIRERTKELKADAKLRVPGLLVIDTPGHESFSNLRSRGSGLCDIAVLVVDIMHGLEPQTIESLNLLKMRNTEFIVALNKVDRLYGWKTCPNAPIQKALKQQSNDVQNEFKMRLTQIITQFKEQGMNTELYYKNKEMGETFSIVPTSAISGEGIPDLLLLLVQWTSKTMVEKLMFSDEVQCTVLEVKVVEGLGTTIDVVLVNGVLHEEDKIVVCGMQGPIVTTIRALLTPHPMKEIRVKGQYLHHKELKAAQGVKIAAQGLENAIAGTGLYVVRPGDDEEDIKEAATQDMRSVMSRIDKSGMGVYVQASTLGSLEALLEFLKSPAVNIPVSEISIGPVHKRDVMKASAMLEKKKEYATILAFDVKVAPEARELAEETGVKIFIADIIYHLFDQFKHYIDNLKEEKKKEAAEEAVFPCVMQIIRVFNKKDPIVLGVDVIEGVAKVGTPMCIPSRDFIDIGRIASIEINHKQVDVAKKGSEVALKISSTNPEEQQKMFGRHFDEDDELVSHITRKSIDVLKDNYREELSNEEWRLVVKLKNLFKIQ